MHEINEILKKYNLNPKKYIRNKNVIYIETNNKKYVIKKCNTSKTILDYLKSRNFNYLPEKLTDDKEYEIMEYIEEYDIPKEQKIIDLINLVSLLHNKTTHYKETTEDDYKEIYEDINNNIEHLYSYYNDLMTIIETRIYMSPSQYVIARNISLVYEMLYYAKEELENWYKIVKENKKQRLVVLHNNLRIDHILINKNKYLISWDKSKIGIPIFDLFKLYKNTALEFEFEELFKIYEKNYPLKDDERKLFLILISLPPKIENRETEYENTKEAGKIIEYMYKTKMFVSPYNPNERPKDNTHKNKN